MAKISGSLVVPERLGVLKKPHCFYCYQQFWLLGILGSEWLGVPTPKQNDEV